MINHKDHHILESYAKISKVGFTEVDNQPLTL